MENSPQMPSSAPQSGPSAGGQGLAPNVAGALSYVLGFITGVIFLIISKDKFVRFHAMQSIIVSVLLWIVDYALGMFFYRWFYFSGFYSLAVLALFIFLIYQAYQNKLFKLPVLGDLAEKWSAKA